MSCSASRPIARGCPLETEHTTESARTPASDMGGACEHLTLTEAAKMAPGRPSTSCVWRWCRRGVLSRMGERVQLRHMRVGGKLFTTASWLNEFGNRLAEADAAHFRLTGDDAVPPPARSPARKSRRERFEKHRRDTVEQANQELKDAGL